MKFFIQSLERPKGSRFLKRVFKFLLYTAPKPMKTRGFFFSAPRGAGFCPMETRPLRRPETFHSYTGLRGSGLLFFFLNE